LVFRSPVVTSYGLLRERSVLELRIEEGELVGVGEASPLEPYDGVSLDAAREALERCLPLLSEGSVMDREELVDACWLEAGLPQAVAAVDVALWDLEARRAGVPLASLLASSPASAVPVNGTVVAVDRAGAASEASDLVRAGFGCLKLKVGVGDDAGRLAAVRAAVGPSVALRVDANGAWASQEEAEAALGALAPVGLELVEEPVRGVDELRALKDRVSVPLVMDETASLPGAVGSGAADGVCLKLSAVGGISGVLAAASAARGAGSFVYLSSTYDGPVGIAAGVHTAAALAPTPPNGLATLDLFASLKDWTHQGVHNPSAIEVPTGPGLGI
jgi:L-alanine-DL-glutamate epimerase-like enolase superfamily enzyme